jgi:hypothetical protein
MLYDAAMLVVVLELLNEVGKGVLPGVAVLPDRLVLLFE